MHVILKRLDSIAVEKKSAHLQVQLDGIHGSVSTLCAQPSSVDGLVSGHGECILLLTLNGTAILLYYATKS